MCKHAESPQKGECRPAVIPITTLTMIKSTHDCQAGIKRDLQRLRLQLFRTRGIDQMWHGGPRVGGRENEKRDTHQWKSESTQLFTVGVSRKNVGRAGLGKRNIQQWSVTFIRSMEEWPLFHSESWHLSAMSAVRMDGCSHP